SMAKSFGVLFPNKILAILPQDLCHIGVGIPPQSAPDEFIHIIIATLRVSQKADGVRFGFPKDNGLALRPRVDALAGFGNGIRHIPIGTGNWHCREWVMSG